MFEQEEILAAQTKRDLTVSAGRANLLSIVFALPILFVFGFPYFLIWGFDMGKYTSDDGSHALLGFFFIVGGIVVHELIHGISWAIFTKHGFRAIRFGIIWKYLTPYCHCNEPLHAKHYRFGAIMPAVLLGFIPSVTAILNGNIDLLFFGLIFTIAASGDFLILWLIREQHRDTWVQDHPSEPGCIVAKSEVSNPK